MREPTILHADLDAFYASVELLDRPDLTGRPVVVGGGVVLSASYAARRFGVRSGMSGREARQICPGLISLRGHMSRYLEISDTVMEIFGEFTPLVEPLSIDEAFLNISGARHLFGEAATIATAIRQRVTQATGLTISVGGARTKFLAKVASQVVKPDGVLVVPVTDELTFLHALPVRYLWGVGPKTTDRLLQYGIITIADLAAIGPTILTAALGRATARHLHALAWNRDPRGVETRRRAKTIGAESTFGGSPRDHAEHSRILVGLADRVAGRLRKKALAAGTVRTKVRFEDFETRTHSYTPLTPVATAGAIHHIARRLVAEMAAEYSSGRGLRLLGISLAGLRPATPVQLELPFEHGSGDVLRAGSEIEQHRRRLDGAYDDIRARYGRSAIAMASVSTDRPPAGATRWIRKD